MSDSFQITVEGQIPELLKKLEGFPEQVQRAAVRGIARGNQLVIGKITRERLTGQGPFPPSEHRVGVKTNRLRQSVRAADPQINGDDVTTEIGSNVKYAGVHEFGYKGTVRVKGFVRKRKEDDRFTLKGARKSISRADAVRVAVIGKNGRITRGQGQQTSSGVVYVKPHDRKMNMPARRMFATGLQEHGSIYATEVQRELETEWKSNQ